MKKIIIILLCLLLYGCYDYTEINDLVIITGMIIDYKDNQYSITTQLIENEKDTKIKVYNTKGNSIDECISEISKLSNKDIFISHLKILILTESTINSDVNYYDYFLRNSKSKMNFYVYFIEDKYKDEILDIYSSLYIKDLMDFNKNVFSSSTPVSFLDLIYKKYEYGLDEIYPNLIIKNNNDKKVLYLEDIIIFNQNKDKIILDDQEGIYYNMLVNKLNKTSINIPCDNELFTLSINDVNTNYEWKNNIFNFDISITGKIINYECKYDLNKPNSTKELSTLANNYIKDNIDKLINKSKKNKVDFLGIGNYIFKHDNNYFDFKNNNWNEKLPSIKTNINVDTTINSIGEMRK